MCDRLIRHSVSAMCGVAALLGAACIGTSPSAVRSGASPTASSGTAASATPPPSSTAAATSTPAAASSAAAESYRDATYEVSGRPVALKNGVAEVEAAPGSASKVTTRVFGNEATGDLNGDGTADVAFVLTQSPGGSGTFYCAVAALKTLRGYTGTNAILLGDRIAPQNTVLRDGLIEVNYAERRPGEPMTAPPSVGVTKRLRVVDGRLVEAR